MVNVVTMSANTAAYAAEAIKPSQRMRGDAPVADTISLLAAEKRAAVDASRGVAAALRRPTSLSLMLMNGNEHLPQATTQQAIDRYLENTDEIDTVDPGKEDRRGQEGSGEPDDDREDRSEDERQSPTSDGSA